VNRDLRKYAKQTNIRLSIGFVLLLFIVGDGLIYLFYGPSAAITGLICLCGAGLPIILILAALWFIEWIGKHSSF
jgi:TM2 domain-containing membrane protein YozV